MLRFLSLILAITIFLPQDKAISNENGHGAKVVAEKKEKAEATSQNDTFTPVGGGVEVDLKNSVLRIPIELVGKGNEKDPSRSLGLEFLVSTGKDKDYESMFASSARGQHLHMALLMIGREPSAGKAPTPASANLHLEVELGGARKAAVKWMTWSDTKPVKDLSWYFRGSEMIKAGKKSTYAADESLSLVGAMSSPVMVIEPGVGVGNPYNEMDVHLVPTLLPDIPLGTQGWLWIKAR